MHRFRQHTLNPLLFLSVVLIIQIAASLRIDASIPCDALTQNCASVQNDASHAIHTYPQLSIIWRALRTSQLATIKLPLTATKRLSTSRRPLVTTSRSRSTTRRNDYSDFDTFATNLKHAAIILASIAIGLGILRVCLICCKSTAPNSARRTSVVRPREGASGRVVKADLPPAYIEAMAQGAHGADKLPAYEELPHELWQQIQMEDDVYSNNGILSTQM